MLKQDAPGRRPATASARTAGRRVAVRVPAALRGLADNQACIHIQVAAGWPDEARVGEVLAGLRTVYPGVHHAVLDERGAVRPHVNVYVGTQNIRFSAGLATPVPEPEEVWILPAVSGG
jgi:molybdopterin converting factor small subunit